MPHCAMDVLSTDGEDVIVSRRTMLTTTRYRIDGEQPYVSVRMSWWFRAMCLVAIVVMMAVVFTLREVELGVESVALFASMFAGIYLGTASMISHGVFDSIQDNARKAARGASACTL